MPAELGKIAGDGDSGDSSTVIPAYAGIPTVLLKTGLPPIRHFWIPAYAGMTVEAATRRRIPAYAGRTAGAATRRRIPAYAGRTVEAATRRRIPAYAGMTVEAATRRRIPAYAGRTVEGHNHSPMSFRA